MFMITPHDMSPLGPVSADPLRPGMRPPAAAVVGQAGAAHPIAAAPNPTLRLDSGLGMVVIEFRGASGEVVASLPTPREIAAYRMAAIMNAPDAGDTAEDTGPSRDI